jgi:DNA-binding MarR family transcriptional regulator
LKDTSSPIDRIVERQCEFFSMMFRSIPDEWVESELTMPQLKTLLLLSHGPTRMRDVADGLAVSTPTATGIVDRLVSAGLVARNDDPLDRRIVACCLTDEGEKQASAMWNSKINIMRQLLGTLTESDLVAVETAIDVLHGAASALNQQQPQPEKG